jgi:hypothetical protein
MRRDLPTAHLLLHRVLRDRLARIAERSRPNRARQEDMGVWLLTTPVIFSVRSRSLNHIEETARQIATGASITCRFISGGTSSGRTAHRRSKARIESIGAMGAALRRKSLRHAAWLNGRDSGLLACTHLMGCAQNDTNRPETPCSLLIAVFATRSILVANPVANTGTKGCFGGPMAAKNQ